MRTILRTSFSGSCPGSTICHNSFVGQTNFIRTERSDDCCLLHYFHSRSFCDHKMALSVVLCIFAVAPILEISKFSFLLLIDISVLLKDSSGGSWGRGRGPSSIFFIFIFGKNMPNNRLAPPSSGVGAPPSGKSWIRHWIRNQNSIRYNAKSTDT